MITFRYERHEKRAVGFERLRARRGPTMRVRMRYMARQWKYNRNVVCIATHCWRMVCDDSPCYCERHVQRYG